MPSRQRWREARGLSAVEQRVAIQRTSCIACAPAPLGLRLRCRSRFHARPGERLSSGAGCRSSSCRRVSCAGGLACCRAAGGRLEVCNTDRDGADWSLDWCVFCLQSRRAHRAPPPGVLRTARRKGPPRRARPSRRPTHSGRRARRSSWRWRRGRTRRSVRAHTRAPQYARSWRN